MVILLFWDLLLSPQESLLVEMFSQRVEHSTQHCVSVLNTFVFYFPNKAASGIIRRGSCGWQGWGRRSVASRERSGMRADID